MIKENDDSTNIESKGNNKITKQKPLMIFKLLISVYKW